MNIELIIQNSNNGKIFEVSQLVSTASWDTEISGQPGKLSFTLVNDTVGAVTEGSRVSFKVDNRNVFFGYIFRVGKKEDDTVSVVAYDQIRYLKNKDTYVFSGMTASQIFEKLCKDYKLAYRIVSPATYTLGARVYDNNTLYDIIDSAVGETLTNTGVWYIVRDNFGTLEFVDLASLRSNLFIGDKSLTTGYSYEGSIDSDTYNRVKLIQENKKTKKREIYIVEDSSTQKQWGMLQYFEKMDKDVNAAQIAARAEALLKLKNRVTKSLKLSCLGDLRVSAGVGVAVSISGLSNEGLAQPKYFVVKSCSHKFENDLHTMSIELQVTI